MRSRDPDHINILYLFKGTSYSNTQYDPLLEGTN